APISTNVLGLGAHVISLVVSDGKLTATNTITINVITVEQAVGELSVAVHDAGLPAKTIHPLLDPLEDAGREVHDGHVAGGISQLKEFQEKVHERVAKANPAIAQ